MSRELVASSSNNKEGLCKTDLAIAILCFCPPDNFTPLSPRFVLYPSGNLSINSVAAATCAAEMISASEAFGLLYDIFFQTSVSKITGSWGTTPIFDLNSRGSTLIMFKLSKLI